MPTENRSSNTEMVSVLLPCPFCAQQDFLIERLDSDASVVICQGLTGPHEACLARGPVGVAQDEGEEQPGRDKAVELWNARAEQHQGEPAVLPARKPEPTEESDVFTDSENSGFNACLDEIAKLGPLYTLADPGEVERLRLLVSAGQEIEDHLSKQVDIANITISALRAHLAERDALLRDLEGKTILSWPDKHRISAALSASAEPSAPVERAGGDHG